MDHRIINPHLRAIKPVPARARNGQMLGATIDALRRNHLTVLALMPRLATRLTR